MDYKILVVSDTHSETKLLDQIIKLENPTNILHAGDHEFTLDYLNNNKITFVKGNNDFIGDIYKTIKFNDITICLTHGHNEYSPFYWHEKLISHFQSERPNIIIYGHSHKELIEKIDNVTILNPGSLTYPRNQKMIKTYAIIEIQENNYEIKIINLLDN